MQNGQSAGKSFAYILGTYLSDGCVTKEYGKNVFRLEVMDEDYAIAFFNALKRYGVNHLKSYKIKNERYKRGYSFFVVTRDNDLCERLLLETNRKSIIPSYVFKWDKHIKREFIAGMMDGEGYASKRKKPLRNGSQNYQLGIGMEYKLLEQFKRILQSVGVSVGKFTFAKKVVNKQVASISLNIKSWHEAGCYFYIQRHQSRINEYIRNTNLNDYTSRAV
jgi:DNA-binding transcriptional regulator WhiA